MSYQVLARRWRPQTFAQMVGQEHVLRALVNALERNRLHHAYLLTGTRGVGKTTLARLIAKCLNCEQGISASPCGECAACREIAEGRFVDLLEIDAASRTKVEDTRDLLENVQYAPARGRFKVYLIDEVHMLSTHSFNALLKTLEEPPPHVKFLLATTDPQKLPATVLSRCLQLHLKNLSPEQISAHLAHVLREEAIEFEEPALWELAVAAEGSMRDALSLTDQAIAHGGGSVATATVTEMLGYIERELLRALVEALLQASAENVLAVVADMAAHGADFERALSELLAVLHRVALAQTVPATLAAMHAERERFAHWAALAAPADVQLYYQIGLMCRRDLPYAPDARSGLEMALLRMLAFRPAQPGDARIAAAPAPVRAAPPRSEPAGQGAVAPPKKPEPAASEPAGVRAAPQPPGSGRAGHRGGASACSAGCACRDPRNRCGAGSGSSDAGGSRGCGGAASHAAGYRACCSAGRREHGQLASGAGGERSGRHAPHGGLALPARGGGGRDAATAVAAGARDPLPAAVRRAHRRGAGDPLRACRHGARAPGPGRGRDAGGACRAHRRRAPAAGSHRDRGRRQRAPADGEFFRETAPRLDHGAGARRHREGRCMKGLNDLLKQAQQLQEQVKSAQEDIARQEVQGEAGGGLVRVTMTGRHDVRRVHIEPSLLGEDREVIEDLVAAAVNDAVRRVEALQREKLAGAAGGLSLPDGFKLPF